MKRNAIARIIIYSVLAIVLTGILVSSLAMDGFLFHISSGSSTEVVGEVPVEASQIKNIEINWAAGSVTIRVSDKNHITISEVAQENSKYKMTYEISGDTLALNYSNVTIGFGLGNWTLAEKDLIITVPKDWVCDELQINGAALDIDLQDLTVGKIELDGADCDLNFTGSLEQMDTDGAATTITLVCTNRISNININGASCDLELTLPQDCGFMLQMDGLSCDLHTDLPGTNADGKTLYGDGHCRINVDGISCKVRISESAECAHVWNDGQEMTIPGDIEKEMIYTCTICGEIKSEPILHSKHAWDKGTPLGNNTIVYRCTVCGQIQTLTATEPEPERHGFIWLDWQTRKLLEDQIFEHGYFEGAEIVFTTEIFTDYSLELYCDGEFVCGPTVVGDHWEFYYTMPNHIVYIELRKAEMQST